MVRIVVAFLVGTLVASAFAVAFRARPEIRVSERPSPTRSQEEVRARSFVVVDADDNEVARFTSKGVGRDCVELRLGRADGPQIKLFSQPREVFVLVGDPEVNAVRIKVADAEKMRRADPKSDSLLAESESRMPCVTVSLFGQGAIMDQSLTLGGDAVFRISSREASAGFVQLEAAVDTGATVAGGRDRGPGFALNAGTESRPGARLFDGNGSMVWEAK